MFTSSGVVLICNINHMGVVMKRKFATITSDVVIVEQSVRDDIIALGSSTGAVYINRMNESIYVDVEDVIALSEDIGSCELHIQQEFNKFVALLAKLVNFEDNKTFLASGLTILYVSVK